MRTSAHSIFAAAFIASLAASPTSAQEIFKAGGVSFAAEIVAQGLDHPWGMDFLPGGEILVTERSGALRILSQVGLSDPVEGVPEVWAQGQGGLLDVKAAPDFEQTGTVFITFAEPGSTGAGTALARAKLVRSGADAKLENVEVIFTMDKKSGRGQHFGSRIAFGPDGTIFLTTGDRGDGRRAQDMMDSAGAVLRINQDGSVPADNPYAASDDALHLLWSKGHRNIQGATYDPVTDGLVTVEHGAKGGDEINLPKPGKNYGWPIISYGVNYNGSKIGSGTSAEGLEQPIFYWDPSIAPSGLAVYRGDMFPEWQGDLLVGSLKFGLLSRLDRDESGNILDEERMLKGAFGRIRDVDVAPDGAIWLLTDESDGAIIRLSRTD